MPWLPATYPVSAETSVKLITCAGKSMRRSIHRVPPSSVMTPAAPRT